MKNYILSGIQITVFSVVASFSSMAAAEAGQPESLAPGLSEPGRAPLEIPLFDASLAVDAAMHCSVTKAMRQQDLRTGQLASNRAEDLYLRYSASTNQPAFQAPVGHQVIAVSY